MGGREGTGGEEGEGGGATERKGRKGGRKGGREWEREGGATEGKGGLPSGTVIYEGRDKLGR